jgi:hypothetical protein
MNSRFVTALGFCIAITTAAALSACSAKIGDAPADNFSKMNDKVTGPSLTGQWISDCSFDRFGSNYRVISMTVNGKKVHRTVNQYSNSTCATMVDSAVQDGSFHFTKSTANGGFEVEYAFKLSNGWTYYVSENIKPEADTLWVSEMVTGDASPTTPLHRN